MRKVTKKDISVDKTRLSLFYLAGYLWLGGIGFLIVPRFSTELFLSNTVYSDVMVSAFGMFMVGLGIIVVQIIRLRLHALYYTTLIVRIFFCVCLLALYYKSSNLLFLMLFGVVGIGVVLTGISYLVDSQGNQKPDKANEYG